MKYLLDTDICVYFLNQNKKIVEKLQRLPEKDLAISVLTTLTTRPRRAGRKMAK
jgi:predicted nucleic acid-binding protein